MKPAVVLLGTADCHLCEGVARWLVPLARAAGRELVFEDAAEAPERWQGLLTRIPVVFVDGREVAWGRIQPEDLAPYLPPG